MEKKFTGLHIAVSIHVLLYFGWLIATMNHATTISDRGRASKATEHVMARHF